ncbi:MAG: CBS domain-containing protein [Methanosarcinaceae archaeon]|nr:CBS domain-containing protein [Methanosarcinaceae archaeon]
MQVPTAEDLKQKRLELGLTQSALAKRAGVSQPLIARIENNGVDPRLSTVSKIVQAFDDFKKEKHIQVKDIITHPVVHVKPTDTADFAINIMNEHGFSQLPVIEYGIPVGSLSEGSIVKAVSEKKQISNMRVSDLMEESFPTVPLTTPILTVSHLLERSPAVLVLEKGLVIGVVTKSNIIKSIE